MVEWNFCHWYYSNFFNSVSPNTFLFMNDGRMLTCCFVYFDDDDDDFDGDDDDDDDDDDDYDDDDEDDDDYDDDTFATKICKLFDIFCTPTSSHKKQEQ